MSSQEQSAGQPNSDWPVLEFSLGALSVFLLVAMTALTCVDVVARYWFNSPVNGAFELTQMLLAGLVFAALPITTATGQHVDVQLFAFAAGKRLQKLFYSIGQTVSAVVLLVLSWRIWAHAERLAHDGAVSNSLGFPYAPIGYFASISCCLSGIVALILVLRIRRSG